MTGHRPTPHERQTHRLTLFGAVARSGYYPTQQCVRCDNGANTDSLSLEAFVYREAR